MKFKIGDKVRVIKEVVQNRYMLGEYEIITDIAPNHDVMGRCIKLAYPLNDKLEDDTMFEWREDELMYFDNDPIAALQEEIATLKAALNASNAALAEAKKLIREVADNDVSIFKNMSDAMQLVASWDSAAVAATTQDAPKQEVTLTDIEIDWLCLWDYTDKEGLYAFSVPSGKMNVHIVEKMALEIRLYDFPMHNWWRLDSQYDTPANRRAIEARRKKESE